MNKKLTMRLFAAFAVALMFSFTLSAQILGDADWVEGGYGGGATAGQEIDSVTVGATTRYFVEPDPYYHPLYNAGGNWSITDGASWDWFQAYTSSATADYSNVINDTNYIDITWGANVGLDSIGVAEVSIAGGCNGDTSYLKVQTLAEPTLDFVADAAGTNIGVDYTACEGDARLDGTEPVLATLTGIAPVSLDYALEIWTYNADSSSTTFYQLDKTNATVIASDSAAAYRAYDSTAVSISTNLTSYTLVQPNDAGDNSFSCITTAGLKSSTVYKYTLVANNGRISRKSDYLSNPNGYERLWSWYNNFTGVQTITIVVHPTPNTGPIYHISNTWAN